jgi:hypothetical protein
VLVHTGFFKDVARISFALVGGLSAVAALAIWANFDIVQFERVRRGVLVRRYRNGGIDAVGLMIRGPIRLAHAGPEGPLVAVR